MKSKDASYDYHPQTYEIVNAAMQHVAVDDTEVRTNIRIVLMMEVERILLPVYVHAKAMEKMMDNLERDVAGIGRAA